MILAIDTSSKTATAAIVENKTIITEYSVYSDKTHSKALLPMIESMFKTAGIKIEDIDYFACVNGPGSFTGLRIGAAVIKSFAYVLSKKIAPVSSLDILAYGAAIPNHTICSVIDARNRYVYVCFYDYPFLKLTDYMVVSIEQAVAIGKSYSKPLFFVGSGAEAYVDFFSKNGGCIARPHLNRHSAGVLGVFAQHNSEIKLVEANDFVPVYYRRQEKKTNKLAEEL